MKRKPSDAAEALKLLQTLSRVAQDARKIGWEVNISMESAQEIDRLSFAAQRAVPPAEET